MTTEPPTYNFKHLMIRNNSHRFHFKPCFSAMTYILLSDAMESLQGNDLQALIYSALTGEQRAGRRIPGCNSYMRATCNNSIHASGWKPQKYIPGSQPNGCPIQSALNTTPHIQLVSPHTGQKGEM